MPTLSALWINVGSSITVPAAEAFALARPDVEVGYSGKSIDLPPETLGTTSVGQFRNAFDLEFVRVPSGKAWLGGEENEPGETAVTVAENFCIGKLEVTQAQWPQLDNNPSYYSRSTEASSFVDGVSDALLEQFLSKACRGKIAKCSLRAFIDARAKWDGRMLARGRVGIYLLRRAHARFESQQLFVLLKQPSNRITMQDANVQTDKLDPAYLSRERDVGAYPTNALGGHDMHGNVAEWCSDLSFSEPPRSPVRKY